MNKVAMVSRCDVEKIIMSNVFLGKDEETGNDIVDFDS
jgi:hypothetical protein